MSDIRFMMRDFFDSDRFSTLSGQEVETCQSPTDLTASGK